MSFMGWRFAAATACGATVALGACSSTDSKPTVTAVKTTVPTAPDIAPSTAPGSTVPVVATTVAASSSPAAAAPVVTTQASDAATAAASRSATSGAPEASMVVSGFVSDTLTEVHLSTPRCHAGGSGTNAGFEFAGSTANYAVTFLLPNGATTFPTSPSLFVSIVNVGDSSQMWTIGGKQSPSAAGTASFDGAQGSVDVDMVPDPPNPALSPLHLKGSFAC